MKPIKKETVTAFNSNSRISALGAVLLTGAVALAATGCAAEVKADGITIESLFVSGTADDFTSDIDLNALKGSDEVNSTESTLPDGIGARLSDQGEANATEPSISLPADETKPSEVKNVSDGNNGSGEIKPSENSQDSNVQNSGTGKGTFGKLKEGTVLLFDEKEEFKDFRLNGDFGFVKVTCDEYSNVVFNINSREYKSNISSVCMTDVYLIRNNSKTIIYIQVVRGCNVAEINVYEVCEDSVKQVGVESGIVTADCYLNNTKSFMCYEEYEKGGVMVIRRNYKVSDNGMPIPADNINKIDTGKTLAKYDLTGKIVRNGQVTSETKTIRTNEIAIPVEVNEIEYIDFKDADGNIVRVDFTNVFLDYYDSEDHRWVQKAVLSMVKPADDYVFSIRDIKEGSVQKFSAARDKESFFTGDAYTDLVVEPYHRDNVRITYGNKSFEFEISHDHAGAYITSAYLLKNNGKVYIYAVSCLEDDNYTIDVYEVTEDSVKRVGAHYGFGGVETITSTNSFACYEYDGLNGLISLKRYYKVGENGLPVPADYTFYLDTTDPVKTSKDITGFIVRDGKVTNEKVTVKAGERVTLTQIVAMQYLDLKDQNGNTIRLDLEDLFCEYCESGNYFWMIRALKTFIEPA